MYIGDSGCQFCGIMPLQAHMYVKKTTYLTYF